VVFVFATTEPQKIAQSAAPVLSRLQRFDFKRIGPADIRTRLERVLHDEGIAFEPDALAMIARAADGSMRDALSLTDQVLAMGADAVVPDRVRDALGLVAEDELLALFDLIAERRAGDVFGFVARLADAGVDLGQVLTGLTDLLRAQLAIALGGEPPDVSEGTREALEARRNAFAAADLLRMLSIATELEPRFRRSGQQQLLLEAMLVRFALLDRAVSLEAVLRGLGGGSTGAGDEEEPARPTRRAASKASDAGDAPARADASRARVSTANVPRADARPADAAPPDRPPVVRDADRASSPERDEAAPPDLHQLVERWDDLVAAMRAAGKSVAATALEHASPDSVNARGDVTLALDDGNPIYERAIDAAKGDVVAQLRGWFPGVQRILVRAPQGAAPPPARLTDEMVRAERISSLRRKDPVLDAAIDALDLDLAD
jgi:DNA polymerase-3 subunit gamma/tau